MRRPTHALGYLGIVITALIGLACNETDRKLAELERKIINLPEPGTYLTEFDRSWEKVKNVAIPKLKKEVFNSQQKPQNITHERITQALGELDEIQQSLVSYLAQAKALYGSRIKTHDRARKIYLYLKLVSILELRLAQYDKERAADAIRTAPDPDATFEIVSERDENMARAIAMGYAANAAQCESGITLTGLYLAIEKDLRSLDRQLMNELAVEFDKYTFSKISVRETPKVKQPEPEDRTISSGSSVTSTAEVAETNETQRRVVSLRLKPPPPTEVTEPRIPDKTIDEIIAAALAHPDEWRGNQMMEEWSKANLEKLTYQQMLRLQKGLRKVYVPNGGNEEHTYIQTWARMLKRYYFHFVTGRFAITSAIALAKSAPYVEHTNCMLESYVENHKQKLEWPDVEKLVDSLVEAESDGENDYGLRRTRPRMIKSYYFNRVGGRMPLDLAISIAEATHGAEDANCMLESYFANHKHELHWTDVDKIIKKLQRLYSDPDYKWGQTQVSRRILDEWEKMITKR